MTTDTPTIVIIGRPPWLDAASAAIAEAGFTAHFEKAEPGLVTRLVEARASLILLPAAGDRWRWALTAPGVNAATRRLPLVVVTDDADLRVEALSAGAAEVLTTSAIRSDLPSLIERLAWTPDDAHRAELDRQCDQPLPAEAVEAIRLFNAGEYYQQHDAFEALWMAEDGPVRDLYQAVLQVGIAYYQVTRGKRRAAIKMLLRARQWLGRLPGRCRGVDVARLRADAATVQAALEALPGGDDLSGFDRSLLGGVAYEEDW